MKQLLQNMRTGDTLVVDVPVPTPQPGEVLVQTGASLVSAGTERMLVEFAEKNLLDKARSRPDLVRQLLDKARREGLLTTAEAAFNRLDQPIPLGYSSAGRIVALGKDIRGFQVGQRVACAGGAYAVHAEYAAVPTILLTPLPDQVDFECGAFTTLGAIALHGFRLLETQIGERIAVIGLGLLGLMAVQIARAAGCSVLGIDLDPRRVALAGQLGVEAVPREQAGEAAQSFSRGRGCDAILICADTSSSDPVELAGILARDRARVVATGAVGLHIPRKIYYEKELTLLNSRSYGPGRYDPQYEEGGHDYPLGFVRWTEGRNMEAFVDLLASGKVSIEPLITHRFPIERAPEAYELITGKRSEPFLGVLLTYDQAWQQAGLPKVDKVNNWGAKSSSDNLTTIKPAACKLGVLGAGNFATAVMLPALKKIPGVQLIGIASASGLSAKHAAGRFGFRYSASDETALLEDGDINTIAILTRHHLHSRQVVAGLSAGKHVFCEKPLAITPEGLDEIIEALKNLVILNQGSQEIKDTGTQPSLPLLMVGFNRRFAPLAVRMQAFLSGRKEPLMAHYRVNAGYLPLTHWTQDPVQGGGRILGEACHFIDFLTFLVGSVPLAVSSHGLPDGGRYCEDNIVLTLEFSDGSLGTLSYLANGDKSLPKERVEVFTAGRVAVLDDYRSLELIHNGRRHLIPSRLRQDKGHQAEWRAFAQAITQTGEPPIPYEQLVGVTRTAFAAVEALRTGRRVEIQGFGS